MCMENTKSLIELVWKENKPFTIIIDTEEVKIYKLQSNWGNDDWNVIYPYRSIFISNTKWVRNSQVSPSLDTAMLSYLWIKHLWFNSQFLELAMKMLWIEPVYVD